MSDRKRWNRNLKRQIDCGTISAEAAQPLFRKSTPALPLRRFSSQRSSFSSSSVQGATRRSSFSSSSVQGATKAEEDEDKPFNCFRLRQFKGEGKGGSLGVAVGTAKKPEPATRNDAIPPALPANTLQDVQDMFDSGYYAYPETPFWDGRNIGDVDTGTHCLWKNVPTGKRGGESTKVEYFHGECHGWEDGECIVS